MQESRNVSSVVLKNGSNGLFLRRNSEKLNLDGSHQKKRLEKVFGLISVLLSLMDHLVGVDAGGLGVCELQRGGGECTGAS
jgi:hypothetical protein